jgi:hypothetical protein
VSGYLAPATSRRVKLSVYRKVGGRYRRVRSERLAVRNTRFRRALRLTRPGLYRVVVSGDGISTRQYVRVV